MDMFDKNIGKEKLASLELAEASREKEWNYPSFVRELFHGRLPARGLFHHLDDPEALILGKRAGFPDEDGIPHFCQIALVVRLKFVVPLDNLSVLGMLGETHSPDNHGFLHLIADYLTGEFFFLAHIISLFSRLIRYGCARFPS